MTMRYTDIAVGHSRKRSSDPIGGREWVDGVVFGDDVDEENGDEQEDGGEKMDTEEIDLIDPTGETDEDEDDDEGRDEGEESDSLDDDDSD